MTSPRLVTSTVLASWISYAIVTRGSSPTVSASIIKNKHSLIKKIIIFCTLNKNRYWIFFILSKTSSCWLCFCVWGQYIKKETANNIAIFFVKGPLFKRQRRGELFWPTFCRGNDAAGQVQNLWWTFATKQPRMGAIATSHRSASSPLQGPQSQSVNFSLLNVINTRHAWKLHYVLRFCSTP